MLALQEREERERESARETTTTTRVQRTLLTPPLHFRITCIDHTCTMIRGMRHAIISRYAGRRGGLTRHFSVSTLMWLLGRRNVPEEASKVAHCCPVSWWWGGGDRPKLPHQTEGDVVVHRLQPCMRGGGGRWWEWWGCVVVIVVV